MKGDRIAVLVTIALPGLVSWENIIGWTCTRGYTWNGAACRGSPSTCASRETEPSKDGENKTGQYWMGPCMIESGFNEPKLNNLTSDILKHLGSKSERWILLRRVLSRLLQKKKKIVTFLTTNTDTKPVMFHMNRNSKLTQLSLLHRFGKMGTQCSYIFSIRKMKLFCFAKSTRWHLRTRWGEEWKTTYTCRVLRYFYFFLLYIFVYLEGFFFPYDPLVSVILCTL